MHTFRPPRAAPGRRPLLLLLLVLGSARAAGDIPQSFSAHRDRLTEDPGLTLAEVVAAARARTPRGQVLAARAAEAEALRAKSASLVAGQPALSLRYQSDRIGDGDGLAEWETGLEVPLWWPGQRSAYRELAARAEAGLPAAEAALRLSAAGEVREALWAVDLAQSRLALAEQAHQTARALEAAVAKRVRLGELARTDLLLAQDETLAREADALRAATETRHAQRRYRALTGLDRVPAQREEALSQRTAVSETHPLLAQAGAAVARAQAQREVTRAGRRDSPSVLFGTRHERAASGEAYADSVGLTVTVPLGSRAHHGPLRAQAEIAVSEALAERDRLRRELDLAVHEAGHNLEVSRRSLQAAERQNALAGENLRLINLAFESGEADLADVLRVRNRARAAAARLAQQRLALNREIARYNQAVGELP